MNNTKRLVNAALLLAIGLVLPSFFHATGLPGRIFLPMHLPILLAGFIVGPIYAGVLGLLVPIGNHFITGMPPVPTLYTMMLELLFFGLITGFVYEKTKKLMPSLISAIIAGRLVAAVGIYFLSILFLDTPFAFRAYFYAAFVTGLPGIIIQLILIPVILKALEKSRTQKEA